MERSAFYRHLAAKGSMTRTNPELVRLHKATGFSIDHLFKVAIGRRRASLPLAKAVARNSRNTEVTVDTFQVVGR